MASDGDVITYTYSGSKVTEDISDIGEITIQEMHGADGGDGGSSDGGSGGYVEDATADVSDYNTLEVWVGQSGSITNGGWGKNNGGSGESGPGGSGAGGGGSTELWVDSESVLIAACDAGGGGSGEDQYSIDRGGGGGSRGGVGGTSGAGDAEGSGFGGDGSGGLDAPGGDGGQELGIASGGTTTTGGSNAGNAEITIEFLSGNTAPSFDETTVSPTDGETDVALNPTLSITANDADGDSLDVSFYDASDDSQIGSTQSISAGSTASVTWSGRDWSATYSWYAIADDGTTTTTSSTFSFTTTDGVPQNVVVSDDTVEGELTLDWDSESEAEGYYVYRAQSSGSSASDYTQVADVSSPPYTDTGLEDGEQYYYRVSAYD